MSDDDAEKARKIKLTRGIMFGLMAGSGVFLAERYLLKMEIDPALIVATFAGVAVSVFLLRLPDRS